jgi:hypothetical protein
MKPRSVGSRANLLSEVVSVVQVWSDDDNDKMTSVTIKIGQICLMYVKVVGKKVVGLERGPLSLVSTTEELLDRKVAVSV